MLNRVPCMPACQHGLCAKVLGCQRGLCANVLSCQCTNVLTCRKHANFLFLHASVPINVPTSHKVKVRQCFNLACQCARQHVDFATWLANVPKGVPVFLKLFLRNAKGNFYTLLLYEKLYIILDIIVIQICICIVHENCIILHSYTSCHIKGKCVEFLLFEILLVAL